MFRSSLNKLIAALGLSVALTFAAAPVVAVAQVSSQHTVIVAAIADSEATPIDPRYQEPQDYASAADQLLLSIQLAKTGYWVGLALAASQLLIFVMKKLEKTYAIVKKYGAYVILGLSAVAGLLSLVVGGMRWPEAIIVFLGTVAPKLLNDLLSEAGVLPHRLNPDATPVAPAEVAPAEPVAPEGQ